MKNGFSLVELSIVLVILGLLTGGILAGQSLIRAAELRSVSTEYQRYITAIHSFRDKYFQLPGDMNNATSVWGDDNTNCADAAITNGTPGTCNGDGDGAIEVASVNGGIAEMFQFWKQMALAGLIEGTYSGLSGATSTQVTEHGINAPRSKLNLGGWATLTFDMTGANHSYWTNMNYRNELHIGRQDGSTGYFPVMKPDEAWNIDTKLDDGRPQIGKLIAIGWDNCTSAASAADLTGSYALGTNSIECGLVVQSAY